MVDYAIRQIVYVTMLIIQVSGDMHSASADLASIFQMEQQVNNVLSELVSQTETKLGIIRQWVYRNQSFINYKKHFWFTQHCKFSDTWKNTSKVSSMKRPMTKMNSWNAWPAILFTLTD